MEKFLQFVLVLVVVATCGSIAGPASGQEFDESFDHWPIDFRINGRILLANQLADRADVDAHFLRASGGDQAKIVAILWAADDADFEASIRTAFASAADLSWHLADRATGKLNETARNGLDEATGVMLFADRKLDDGDRAEIAGIRDKLVAVVQRGGVVYAGNQITKQLSKTVVGGDGEIVELADGLNLVPDSIIETGYSNEVNRRRVHRVLESHLRSVAIGLEPNTAVELDGRIMRVLGDGRMTVMVGASAHVPSQTQTIEGQASRRQSPDDYLIDLTQWRRMAMERTLPLFPPAKPKPPLVDHGTLVIVGGGGTPNGLMRRFVDLAGGVKHAKLVYIPCSEADHLDAPQRTVEQWKKMGVQQATFVHTKDRQQANSDLAFLEPLTDATGIWFGGGRQWNFADSYYGTTAHKLMKEVLKRGGVIGGSSAGASIQASYLARATPIRNVDIMAPGYERGGLGFIRGVAIDQHFSQRGRQKDMTQLVNRYPQLLGIGLDESTAIIVQKEKADIIGQGKVYFYDRNLPVLPDQPDFIALPAGSSYDLAERKVLESATTSKSDAGDDTTQ